MSKQLKVYGWQGYRREMPKRYPHIPWVRQTREICAAPSKAAVAKIVGRPVYSLFNLNQTGNEFEIKSAMAKPGIVLWRGIDDREGEFWESYKNA